MYHIDKTKFKVPFVCGAKDLGEALRRISEGASMIRTDVYKRQCFKSLRNNFQISFFFFS